MLLVTTIDFTSRGEEDLYYGLVFDQSRTESLNLQDCASLLDSVICYINFLDFQNSMDVRKHYQERLEALRLAKRLDSPPHLSYSYQNVAYHLASKNLEDTLSTLYYDSALLASPENSLVYYDVNTNHAIDHSIRGEKSEALKLLLETEVFLSNEAPWAVKAIGDVQVRILDILMKERVNDLLVKELVEAIDQETLSRHAKAKYLRAKFMLLLQKDPDEAAKLIPMLTEIEYDALKPIWQSDVFWQTKQHQEAIDILKLTIKNFDQRRSYLGTRYIHLARHYLAAEFLDSAAMTLEKAISLKSLNFYEKPRIQLLKAQVAFQNEGPEAARPLLAPLLRDPNTEVRISANQLALSTYLDKNTEEVNVLKESLEQLFESSKGFYQDELVNSYLSNLAEQRDQNLRKAQSSMIRERGLAILVIGLLVIILVLGVLYTMNRRKKAVQIQELNERLKDQNDELEEKVQARTKLLEESNSSLTKKNEQLRKYAFANSHILRAPVSSILGASEILLSSEISPEETHQLIQIVQNEAHRMDDKVREIQKMVDENNDQDDE